MDWCYFLDLVMLFVDEFLGVFFVWLFIYFLYLIKNRWKCDKYFVFCFLLNIYGEGNSFFNKWNVYC